MDSGPGFTYQYCDVGVRSSLPIHELVSCAAEVDYDCEFSLLNAPTSSADDYERKWRLPNSDAMLSCRATDADQWRIRFGDQVLFEIDLDSGHILCRFLGGAPSNRDRHLLLDQVLSRLLAHHGRFMVHSSCVESNGRAIMFLGDSRAGKSTMALGMHKLDFSVLADDCVRAQLSNSGIRVAGTYPSLRVSSEVREELLTSKAMSIDVDGTNKDRIVFAQQEVRSAELVVAYCLAGVHNTENRIKVERMSKCAALMHVMKQVFHLDIEDRTRLEQKLGEAEHFVHRVPMYEVSYPHEYRMLPSVCQFLRRHAGLAA